MHEFSKQMETANLKEEVLNDALADVFDENDVEDDLGVELDEKMVWLDAPSKVPPGKEGEKAI